MLLHFFVELIGGGGGGGGRYSQQNSQRKILQFFAILKILYLSGLWYLRTYIKVEP